MPGSSYAADRAEKLEQEGGPEGRLDLGPVKIKTEECAFLNENTLAWLIDPHKLNDSHLQDIYAQREEDFEDPEVLEIWYMHNGKRVMETVFVDTTYKNERPRICVSLKAVHAMHRAIAILTRKLDNTTIKLRSCRTGYHKELMHLRDLVGRYRRGAAKPAEGADEAFEEHHASFFLPTEYQDDLTVNLFWERMHEATQDLKDQLVVKQNIIGKLQVALNRRAHGFDVSETAEYQELEQQLTKLKDDYDNLEYSLERQTDAVETCESRCRSLESELEMTEKATKKNFERQAAALKKAEDSYVVVERQLRKERKEFQERFEKQQKVHEEELKSIKANTNIMFDSPKSPKYGFSSQEQHPNTPTVSKTKKDEHSLPPGLAFNLPTGGSAGDAAEQFALAMQGNSDAFEGKDRKRKRRKSRRKRNDTQEIEKGSAYEASWGGDAKSGKEAKRRERAARREQKRAAKMERKKAKEALKSAESHLGGTGDQLVQGAQNDTPITGGTHIIVGGSIEEAANVREVRADTHDIESNKIQAIASQERPTAQGPNEPASLDVQPPAQDALAFASVKESLTVQDQSASNEPTFSEVGVSEDVDAIARSSTPLLENVARSNGNSTNSPCEEQSLTQSKHIENDETIALNASQQNSSSSSSSSGSLSSEYSTSESGSSYSSDSSAEAADGTSLEVQGNSYFGKRTEELLRAHIPPILKEGRSACLTCAMALANHIGADKVQALLDGLKSGEFRKYASYGGHAKSGGRPSRSSKLHRGSNWHKSTANHQGRQSLSPFDNSDRTSSATPSTAFVLTPSASVSPPADDSSVNSSDGREDRPSSSRPTLMRGKTAPLGSRASVWEDHDRDEDSESRTGGYGLSVKSLADPSHSDVVVDQTARHYHKQRGADAIRHGRATLGPSGGIEQVTDGDSDGAGSGLSHSSTSRTTLQDENAKNSLVPSGEDGLNLAVGGVQLLESKSVVLKPCGEDVGPIPLTQPVVDSTVAPQAHTGNLGDVLTIAGRAASAPDVEPKVPETRRMYERRSAFARKVGFAEKVEFSEEPDSPQLSIGGGRQSLKTGEDSHRSSIVHVPAVETRSTYQQTLISVNQDDANSDDRAHFEILWDSGDSGKCSPAHIQEALLHRVMDELAALCRDIVTMAGQKEGKLPSEKRQSKLLDPLPGGIGSTPVRSRTLVDPIVGVFGAIPEVPGASVVSTKGKKKSGPGSRYSAYKNSVVDGASAGISFDVDQGSDYTGMFGFTVKGMQKKEDPNFRSTVKRTLHNADLMLHGSSRLLPGLKESDEEGQDQESYSFSEKESHQNSVSSSGIHDSRASLTTAASISSVVLEGPEFDKAYHMGNSTLSGSGQKSWLLHIGSGKAKGKKMGKSRMDENLPEQKPNVPEDTGGLTARGQHLGLEMPEDPGGLPARGLSKTPEPARGPVHSPHRMRARGSVMPMMDPEELLRRQQAHLYQPDLRLDAVSQREYLVQDHAHRIVREPPPMEEIVKKSRKFISSEYRKHGMPGLPPRELLHDPSQGPPPSDSPLSPAEGVPREEGWFPKQAARDLSSVFKSAMVTKKGDTLSALLKAKS